MACTTCGMPSQPAAWLLRLHVDAGLVGHVGLAHRLGCMKAQLGSLQHIVLYGTLPLLETDMIMFV